MRIENKRDTLGRGVVLAAVAVLFLLLFSGSTSPLSDFCGADSAFFRLVGKGMTQGMLPYRDFFDMKGPYLFFIEYIGQLICAGRTGAFLIQCINLFLSLWIMDAVFRMALGESRRAFLFELACTAACLAYGAGTFEYGNLTEEFSLPWLLLAVYFALRYLKQSEETGAFRHPAGIGFYYGFAFGVLALIRVTNAAMIGAIILTIALGLLVKKEIKNLLLNGGMFLLGCGAAFLPMGVYYASQGLLGEMLSQVFLFGVQYSAEISLVRKAYDLLSGMWAYVLIALLPVMVLAVYRVRCWRYWLLSVSSFGLLALAAAMGNGYLHYFTLGIPNLVLGFGLLLEQLVKAHTLPATRWDRRKAAAVLLSALMFALPCRTSLTYAQMNLGWIRNAGTQTKEAQDIQDIKSCIPESDYGSVYAYGMASCSSWYAEADLLPSHRYCDWQAHYIGLNPEIGDELAAWLAAETPKWVVVPADRMIAPEQIAEAIYGHYREHARNDAYILYTADSNPEK